MFAFSITWGGRSRFITLALFEVFSRVLKCFLAFWRFLSRFRDFYRVLEVFNAFWTVLTSRYGGCFRRVESFGNFFRFRVSDWTDFLIVLWVPTRQKLLPFGCV